MRARASAAAGLFATIGLLVREEHAGACRLLRSGEWAGVRVRERIVILVTVYPPYMARSFRGT